MKSLFLVMLHVLKFSDIISYAFFTWHIIFYPFGFTLCFYILSISFVDGICLGPPFFYPVWHSLLLVLRIWFIYIYVINKMVEFMTCFNLFSILCIVLFPLLFFSSICYKRYSPAGFEEVRCNVVRKPYD